MDLNQLRALLAAPLASLFLILSLCAFILPMPPVSTGMVVPVLQTGAVPLEDCQGVDRMIVVLLHKDRSVWLNETPLPVSEMRTTLTDIYINRKEKMILMFADPDISYGEFANFYSEVASSTNGLSIELRTRGLQAQLDKCPLGSACGVVWPDHRFPVSCEYRRIPMAPSKHR